MRLGADDRLQVCLVTSRTTQRWVIPKGWPMRGLTDDDAAAQEAHEEAGVRGKVMPTPIGHYGYWRRAKSDFRHTKVLTFVLRVKKQSENWKEAGERLQCWLGVLDAADRVQDPELSSLIVRLPDNRKACRFIFKKKPWLF
ncbi:NUDIX hydrolase [Aureimonas psammosilenae]|uniref:NUDIX hydrolase n=1 Tax=Aureimonas psammosilenae TaxID=2495496 RepID=UPI0022A6EF95|nr:NUDIX domain-containing protein [Aureimonas psammosilenae]